MRERASWVLMMGLILGGAFACDGAEPSGNESRSIQDVTVPLGRGASGGDVRAVYDYLHRYGYFENPDLRRQYPDWVPAILQEADPEHYDATLEAAVTVFQRLSGLEQTGQVDRATLALMQTPRCGHPDVDRSLLDDQQKFVLNHASYPSGANVTYGFTTTFTTAQKGAVRAALTTWQNTTNLTFTENTSNPSAANMQFLFGAPTCGNLGCTVENAGAVINGSVTTLSTTLSSNLPLLQHVALHESGHGIGLSHSAFAEAVMYAFAVSSPIVLATDDAVAISMKYDAFETLSGTAIRIAASNSGAVWKLDFNAFLTGGSQISRWNESSKTWTVASTTFGANNIAPISGTEIYYTQTTGDIWHWTNVFSGGSPVKLPHLNGPLSFISSNSGFTWALGAPYVAGCGYTTYALSGTSSWVSKAGCGISLALETGGAAWTVSAAGAVRRYNGSSWGAMGTALANQLAVCGTLGTGGFSAWMNDFNDDDSNSLLRTWNQEANAWIVPRLQGVGRQVAVGLLGQAWTTNIDSGAVLRQRRD